MKQIFLIGIFAVLSLFFAYSLRSENVRADAVQVQTNQSTEPLVADNKQPVLVELFTSEGCLRCPPADRNLAFLEREQPFQQAEVVALSLHVDYWNSPGWKDEFSSPVYTRRQDIYGQKFKLGSTYTPQMVVDGDTQFVGSDLGKAQKAILEAAKTQKAKIEISPSEEKLKIKISELPAHENATIFLAIAEDDLASNVKGGENSGKKLEHASVVRELKSLGMLAPELKGLEIETILQLQLPWKKENLKFVVFVQENESRKVIGTAKASCGFVK